MLARNDPMDLNSPAFATMIMGDPCIVWDPELGNWRMFVFGMPPGHGHAICVAADPLAPGAWRYEGPLEFTDPGAILGESAYKPWVIMDPVSPNRAARPQGKYAILFTTNFTSRFAQRAWSNSLGGPWEPETEPLIPVGDAGEFDSGHIDALTGYWFPEREEYIYFYMGLPAGPQDRRISPLGAAQGVAVEHVLEAGVEKLGPILEPVQKPGHWASGWIGGLQLLPGAEYPWIAVLNASPTAPASDGGPIDSTEPAPSLGGFAWCDKSWPIDGWHLAEEPAETIEEIPESAREAGERDNLWRHHALALPGGRLALYYNAGAYGSEQIYAKVALG